MRHEDQVSHKLPRLETVHVKYNAQLAQKPDAVYAEFTTQDGTQLPTQDGSVHAFTCEHLVRAATNTHPWQFDHHLALYFSVPPLTASQLLSKSRPGMLICKSSVWCSRMVLQITIIFLEARGRGPNSCQMEKRFSAEFLSLSTHGCGSEESSSSRGLIRTMLNIEKSNPSRNIVHCFQFAQPNLITRSPCGPYATPIVPAGSTILLNPHCKAVESSVASKLLEARWAAGPPLSHSNNPVLGMRSKDAGDTSALIKIHCPQGGLAMRGHKDVDPFSP